MGDIIQTMTAGQLADKLGVSRQTMEKRVQRKLSGQGVGLSTPLSAEQVRVLSGRGAAVVSVGMSSAKTKTSTKPAEPKAKENEVPPVKTKEPWYVIAPQIIITLASIFLTIAGLLVFAKWAGVGLGIMFSMFLFSAVMIARDRMKGVTSEQALTTVLRLEIGAAVLHCFTFWRLLPEFPEQFQPFRVMCCVALAAFAAYLSYSAVLTVRNYNAEVPDENNASNPA